MYQVEIISATECKTMNPYGEERPEFIGSIEYNQAESDRDVYAIAYTIEQKNLSALVEESLFPIGSIQKADLNFETKTTIIL